MVKVGESFSPFYSLFFFLLNLKVVGLEEKYNVKI